MHRTNPSSVQLVIESHLTLRCYVHSKKSLLKTIHRASHVVMVVATLIFVPTALGQTLPNNPFALSVRDAAGKDQAITAYFWKPASGESNSPAVVLVHGSGGISASPEGYHAEALSKAGFAVVAIDSFSPRGIANTVTDQGQLSSVQMTRDAFAAKRWLEDSGWGRKGSIAIAGF